MHPRYVAQGIEKARKTISDGLDRICSELHIPPAQPVPFEKHPELRPLRELEAIAERVQAIVDTIPPRPVDMEAQTPAPPIEPPIEPPAETPVEEPGTADPELLQASASAEMIEPSNDSNEPTEPEAPNEQEVSPAVSEPTKPPVTAHGTPRAAKQRPEKELRR